MCLIIDANVAHEFYSSPPHEDAAPIIEWIDRGRGLLVFGGKLADELGKNSRGIRWLRGRLQAGRANRILESKIALSQKQLEASKEIKSNDIHVLALALASGARLLFTGDRELQRDFTNRKIINTPRGKIYSSRKNADLLTRTVCQGTKPR